jgi:glycosyltransferase involved in cell wall biosynthesis
VTRISVVMSVFNGGEFLVPAIQSILGQTFRDFEFIIVDDGSTDGSGDVVASFQDSRIVLVRQENRGLAASLNRGLEIATGELIARQDADDISLPERFTHQVAFLDKNREIAVLGTAALLVDPQGRPFSRFAPFERHERLVKELLLGVCPLVHGSVMARREAIVSAGGYLPVFGHAQDVELWLRMSARYRLANMRDVLYWLRKHDRSVTQQFHVDLKIRAFARAGGFSTATSAQAWQKFAEEFDRRFDRSSWTHRFEAENRLRAAQIAFARGEPWRGIRCAVQAIRLNPRLVADVPRRILHRVRRTLFPIAS